MAAEKLYVQETIANVKRALEIPSDASESDDTIAYTSNRGRKLKRKARLVHEGALDNHFGRNGYKEEIDYYGRKKKIIYRKHDRRKRISADSDEDDSEDADESEEDPYAGVEIDKILAPLESAADLPSHPSLSHVYTSKTLNELIRQSLDKICEEHKHTVKLKNLLTKFMGDDPFINLDKMQWPPEDYWAVAMARNEKLFRDYEFATISTERTVPDTTNKFLASPRDRAASPPPDRAASPPPDPDTPMPDPPNGLPPDPPASPPRAPSPTRMTTRSANPPPNPPPPPPVSPPAQIHSFFIPPDFTTDPDCGLPPAEAEDTRRLLTLAVQRQDEFLRGLNRVRMGLLRAERLRKMVWNWCRSMEGMREYHARQDQERENAEAAGGLGIGGAAQVQRKWDVETGEGVGLSDGEDWYDKEAWGLEEELAKGQEEEDDYVEVPVKKSTRGRRN